MYSEINHPSFCPCPYTSKSSQSCVESESMLTSDESMMCETENFLEYLDVLAEKAVLLRSVENPSKGLIVKPCESSRYFRGGRKKTKRNIRKRFGRNYTAPGVFLTVTYDHETYSKWEAWALATADIKRLLHNITMRYNRAGRKSPRYIWVIEEQSKTGYPHVHFFFPRLKWLLDKDDVQQLWKRGRTRVEKADNVHLGGYICKYITKMGGWSDEALAFIWKNRIRMYGYSRCYNLAGEPEKKSEYRYSYNAMNRTVMKKAINFMRNYSKVEDPYNYLEEETELKSS